MAAQVGEDDLEEVLNSAVLGTELVDETDAELERLYRIRKVDTDKKDLEVCLSNLV